MSKKEGYLIYVDKETIKLLDMIKSDDEESYNEVIKKMVKLKKKNKIKLLTKKKKKGVSKRVLGSQLKFI